MVDIPVELFLGGIGVSIALAIFGFIRQPQIPAMLAFGGLFIITFSVITTGIQFGYSEVSNIITNVNTTDDYAIVFNGIDQYLQPSNFTSMNIGTENFAFWTTLTRLNDTGGFESIFQKRDLSASTNAGYAFYINNNDNLVFEISDGSVVTTITTTFVINVDIRYTLGVSSNRVAELLDIYYYNHDTEILQSGQFGISGQDGSLNNLQIFTIGKRSDADSQFANRYMSEFAYLQNNYITINEFRDIINGIGIYATNYYTFDLTTEDVNDGIDLIPFNNMTYVLLEHGVNSSTEIITLEPNIFEFTELPKTMFALLGAIFMLSGALMVVRNQ